MNMLKNVLQLNALSSGAAGLLLVSFSGYISGLFGASVQWPFVAAGLFLVAFAAFVWAQGRKAVPPKGWIKFIIVLDIIWVADSLIIVLPQLFGLTFIGYLLISGVAAWVALMAFLQTKGLRQYRTAK